ncbi:MAG: alkaline phosphatase family protein [Promethearchaeota archaeon]
MKRRTGVLAFTVFLMLGVTIGSMAVALHGYETYVEFANPYSYVPARPSSSISGMGMTPIANYTIVFVLDGVRADTFFSTEKPNIEALGEWANFTDTTCSTLISVSRTGYGVISSGVNSSESEVISNDYDGEFRADTIWNATVRNSGKTAVVGSYSWYVMFGKWINYTITFSEGQLVNVTNPGSRIETPLEDPDDSTVSQYAQALFDSQRPTLMIVHFSDTDHEGETKGPFSQEYVDALSSEDEYIGAILSKYEDAGILNQTAVVITSDHGMVGVAADRGSHGGVEREALHIPLLIRGPDVTPGIYSGSVHQNSIVPTLSVLLGNEIPSDCSGRVLFECLSLTERQEAIYRMNLAQIRLSQALSRLQVMGYGGMFDSSEQLAIQYLNFADDNFTSSLYAASIASSQISERHSLDILRSAKMLKVSSEVTTRLAIIGVIVGPVLLLLGFLAYRKRNELAWTTATKKLLGVIVVSVFFYFAFLLASILLTGWKFSASYVPEDALDFMVPVFTMTLMALVPAVLVFLALLTYAQKGHSPKEGDGAIWSAMFFALVTITYVGAMVAFIVRNGLGLPWFAPNLIEGTQYFFISISSMGFALFGLVLLLGGLGALKTRSILIRRSRE